MTKRPKIISDRQPERMPTATICVLDADGTLREKKTVPAKSIDNYKAEGNEIIFDHAVDLTPGAYRWTGTKFALKAGPSVPPGPNMIKAFAAAINKLADQAGVDLGPQWHATLKAYRETIDGFDNFDKENG